MTPIVSFPAWKVLFRATLAFSQFFLFVISTEAQSAPNHRLGTKFELADSLYESYNSGRSSLIISRSAAGPYEKELLRTAERVLPDSAVYSNLSLTQENQREFERAASGIAKAVPFVRAVEPRVAGLTEERWWLKDFDGTFTPLAITSGAVQYYVERFRDIVQGRGQFRQPGMDGPDRVKFRYMARVEPAIEHGARHVVVLSMNWNYWCSTMCSMSISHTRRVYFDAQGRVVHIDGDRPARVIAS